MSQSADLSQPGAAVKSAAVVAPPAQSDADRAEAIAAKYLPPEAPGGPADPDPGPEEEASDPEAEPEADAAEPEGEPEIDEEADGEPEAPALRASADKLAQAAKLARTGASKRRMQEAQLRAAQAEQARELEQLRSRVQEMDGFQQSLIRNPAKALMSLGIKSDAIVEDIVRANTPEEKMAALEEGFKEVLEANRRLEQSIQDRERQQLARRQEQAFWSRIDEEASKPERPLLAEQPVEMVRFLTEQTFRRIRQAGEDPTAYEFEEIADAMEAWLSKNRRARDARPAAAPQARAKDARPAPKTLSSKTGSRKFSLPANWADLPDDKRLEILNGQAYKTLKR